MNYRPEVDLMKFIDSILEFMTNAVAQCMTEPMSQAQGTYRVPPRPADESTPKPPRKQDAKNWMK